MRIPIREVTPGCERADICGFVHEVRDLGGLVFLLVRDRTGIIQVTIPKKKVAPAVLDAVRDVPRESVVRVAGSVRAIDKAPGGREVIPEVFEVISRSGSPSPSTLPRRSQRSSIRASTPGSSTPAGRGWQPCSISGARSRRPCTSTCSPPAS